MRVAFLLQDLQLSGGVGVIVEHAAQLRRHHGLDVQLVLARPQQHPRLGYRGLDDVPVLTLDEAQAIDWDVALATWWDDDVGALRAARRRHAYFIQLLEDSTYPTGAPEQLAAAMTTAPAVRFITEARWIAELLGGLPAGQPRALRPQRHPEGRLHLAGDGRPGAEGAPLRIVLEGARGYVHKGVDDALAAVAAMAEPAHVTWVSPHPAASRRRASTASLAGLSHAEMAALFADSHVLLKLSRAEGMYGPPLEAFHMGATRRDQRGHRPRRVRRATASTALVVGWDDFHGTARDARPAGRATGGCCTCCAAARCARRGPGRTGAQSSQWMALALARVAAEPPPPVARRRPPVRVGLLLGDRRGPEAALAPGDRAGRERAADQKAIKYALALRGLRIARGWRVAGAGARQTAAAT